MIKLKIMIFYDIIFYNSNKRLNREHFVVPFMHDEIKKNVFTKLV